MKAIFSKAWLLCLLMMTLGATAQEQEEEKKSLDSGTIQDRFDYVIEKSNRYQEYKVVKMAWLETLKGYAIDSIKAVRKQLAETEKNVTTQRVEIEALKNTILASRDSLRNVETEKNSIEFIGAQMSKSSYKSMMWSVTGGLLALLIFFIYKFKNSNSVTVATQKTLSETQEEFETFKKRAREREQVLKRELQDELNKRMG